MRVAVILVGLGFLTPSYAMSQTLTESLRICMTIKDNTSRLGCFDLVSSKISSASSGQEMTIADVLSDFDALRGKRIQIRGFILMMGETALMYQARGDLTGLFVEIGKLPKDEKKSLFSSCASGCEATIWGKPQRVMMNPGISAEAVKVE